MTFTLVSDIETLFNRPMNFARIVKPITDADAFFEGHHHDGACY